MSQITKQCFIKIYIVARKRQTTELKHKATYSLLGTAFVVASH